MTALGNQPKIRFRVKTKKVLLSILLCVLTVWAYRGSFDVPFIFDDGKAILGNPDIKNLTLNNDRGRPLLFYTLKWNYKLGGFNVRGYHMFNMAVHLASGLLLFSLVHRTLQLRKIWPVFRASALPIAFVSALIWLVHPLQTESVTYVVQRCEAMMGMFYLAALYCLLRGSQSKHPAPWYMGVIAAFACGMASKEVMLTGIALIPMFDRIFLAKSWKQMFQKRWALYVVPAACAAVLAFSMLYTFEEHPRRAFGFGVMAFTPWEFTRTQPQVILHYLQLSFFPKQLCLDYMWPIESNPWKIYPHALAILSMVGLCIYGLTKAPRLAFVGLSFFFILAPTSSFVPIVDLAYEHRMYLPLAPVVILSVLGLYWLAHRCFQDRTVRRPVLATVFTIIVVALMVRTTFRNQDWRDPARLWQTVVDVAPLNWSAHSNLGIALAKRNRPGDVAKAVLAYQEAIRLAPHQPRAYDNLGNLHARAGNFTKAAKYYRGAIESRPDYLPARLHLGFVLDESGEAAQAAKELEELLKLQPKYVAAVARLSWIYSTTSADAVRNGAKSLELAQRFVELTDNKNAKGQELLAAAYAEQGEFEEARACAARALSQLDPATDSKHFAVLSSAQDQYEKNLPYRPSE